MAVPQFTSLLLYTNIITGVIMCLDSMLSLFKADVFTKYHPGYSPSSILELPDCIRAQFTGEYIWFYLQQMI